MELARPVERVREQEVPHLVAPEVEDEGAPVGMRAAARILVLVQSGAVEPAERELVAREVRRHPVQDHADSGHVQRVDERPEVVRLAHRRDRGVEARHLIAPGAGERVVHDRHELDVREAELVGVGDELLREALPAEAEPPRLGVHLVDRERLLQRLGGLAARHPGAVAPFVARLIDPGRGLRRHLGVEGEGVGLQAQLPVRAVHLELVAVALRGLGHGRRPDPGGAEQLEGVHPPVPPVPVADDRDRARVGSPDGERDALVDDVGAEALVDPLMASLAREVEIELADPHRSCSSIRRIPATGIEIQSGLLPSS